MRFASGIKPDTPGEPYFQKPVRALNRLGCVGSTLRHALNSLAVVVPHWLLAHSSSDWRERYGSRFEDSRLPEAAAERTALAPLVGHAGARLLAAIYATEAPTWLRTVPAVETLRRVWVQNYTWADDTTLRWRTNEEAPPAGQYISSPYDHDARYSYEVRQRYRRCGRATLFYTLHGKLTQRLFVLTHFAECMHGSTPCS